MIVNDLFTLKNGLNSFLKLDLLKIVMAAKIAVTKLMKLKQ